MAVLKSADIPVLRESLPDGVTVFGIDCMFEVPFRQLSDSELVDIANHAKVSLSFASNFFKHRFFAEPVSEEMMEELAKLHGMPLADFVPFFEGMQASYQDQEDQLLEESGVMVMVYYQCRVNAWLPEWSVS